MTEPVTPPINTLNAPFWSAANQGRLSLPFCVTSGRAFWPPSSFSPFVTGGGVEWRDADPVGVVVARVAWRRVFQKAFETRLPYGVALIELDAGPRLQAHLTHADAPASPAPGDRVTLRFERLFETGPAVPVAERDAAA